MASTPARRAARSISNDASTPTTAQPRRSRGTHERPEPQPISSRSGQWRAPQLSPSAAVAAAAPPHETGGSVAVNTPSPVTAAAGRAPSPRKPPISAHRSVSASCGASSLCVYPSVRHAS
eukprot:3755883-Prymnesium_polylepis.2